MLAFAIKRTLWLIPTLLVMTMLTYVIMELTPGSPFDLANANGITPEMIAQLEHQYGLDKPWYERYVIYVKNRRHRQLRPVVLLPAAGGERHHPAHPAVSRSNWASSRRCSRSFSACHWGSLRPSIRTASSITSR